MSEPTHYQLSFTSRQAMALFVGLLLALGAAYFLGVLTGLSGRRAAAVAAGPAAIVPTPEPTAPVRVAQAQPAPSPIRPLSAPTVPPFPRPVLGKQPTPAPNLQFFEDQAQSEPTGPAPVPRTPSPAARPASAQTPAVRETASGGFWVQVVSVSSEREATGRRDKLIHRGYHARVLPGEGSRGKLFRVRVGPYASREQAERASERLSREEKVKTWIAPPGR